MSSVSDFNPAEHTPQEVHAQAMHELSRGSAEAAVHLFQSALDRRDASADVRDHSMHQLAVALMNLQRYDEAQAIFDTLLIDEERMDSTHVAAILRDHARLHALLGDHDRAMELIDVSLEKLEQLGQPNLAEVAASLGFKARIADAQGQHALALGYGFGALTLFDAGDNLVTKLYHICWLAPACAYFGWLNEAVRLGAHYSLLAKDRGKPIHAERLLLTIKFADQPDILREKLAEADRRSLENHTR